MSDLPTIGNGTVVRLRNLRHYGEDGSWAEFKHGDKKKVFLAMILGEENFAGPQASFEDLEKMLNRLGWYKKEEQG